MRTKIDGLHQREAFLSCLAIWEGRLTNRRLRELFDISSVRASEWIREFRDRHPGWLDIETKTKSFIATLVAYRESSAPTASLAQYLSLIGLPNAPSATAAPQCVWAAFPDLSPPDPRIYSAISIAIRDRTEATITYRSMREPRPHQRTISPHNLVRAGRRWHVRAYCVETGDFRDYSLRRIQEVIPRESPALKCDADDTAWSTAVEVRLVAHPALSDEQQDLIRFEYFDKTAARVYTCRGALVGYFIQDVRAALDPTKQQPPDYQLAVENVDELRPWVFLV